MLKNATRQSLPNFRLLFFSDNTQANTLRSPGTGEPMLVVPPYMAQSSLILQEPSFVIIIERSRNSANHAICGVLFNSSLIIWPRNSGI